VQTAEQRVWISGKGNKGKNTLRSDKGSLKKSEELYNGDSGTHFSACPFKFGKQYHKNLGQRILERDISRLVV
jgi:hypothetical protein